MDNQVLIASSSSNPAHTPSPLLRLPDELLDEICRLAYADKAVHRPICRRLYPIQRRHLFRTVRLATYAALGLFCRTIRRVAGLRSLVVELHICMEGEPDDLPVTQSSRTRSSATRGGEDSDEPSGSEGDADADAEGFDDVGEVLERPPFQPRQLFNLLERLERLKTLKASALLHVLLFDERIRFVCDRLEALEIAASELWARDGARDEENGLRQLARFPRLTSLALEQYDPESVFPAPTAPLPTFGSLARLSIIGLESETWDAPNLGTLAPNIVDLELYDLDGPACFAEILRQAPTALRRLALRCDPGHASPTPRAASRTEGILPRFADLEELVLCEHSFRPERLLAAFRSLPRLHTLSFEPGSPATDDLLDSLLCDPACLPRLHRLVLNHAECARGPTLESQGWTLPSPSESGPCHTWAGWEEAEWPDGCSESGLAAAQDAGHLRGIVVEGTAVDAVGWDDEFWGEMYRSLLYHGDETGDYSEARDLLSDEFVDEHITDMRRLLGLDESDTDADVFW